MHDIASKRPRGLRREHDLLKLFEAGCDGGRDLSVPTYFGVEPPPLPPAWTDRYRPRLREKRYALKPAAKKAARARAQWRALAAEGKQKPPPQEEPHPSQPLSGLGASRDLPRCWSGEAL